MTTPQRELPYVTVSCAMSIDGYLDSALPPRLALSNTADLDRVEVDRETADDLTERERHDGDVVAA